jgi:hypothetical protein
MPTFEGRVTPADRAGSVYLYLPFDVPDGTTRIEVQYRFDEGSILDLGLFDPRMGPFPARGGFRGWSGSARREVFVATDEATPGYIAGDLPPGRWQVVLGLAKVAPEGCHYRVEVELDDYPRALIPPEGTVGVARLEAGWYRGDLQSHTYYSDARGSPEDLVRVARERGLDFLAVTDHNTHGHHRALAELSGPELLLVPGEEVTTYRGHANVWGVSGWTDFRVEREGDLDRLVRDVHERGGLFSVNHPKATPNCLGCDWEYPVPIRADALEAWQGPWAFQNWESLARYDALLRSGRRLTLVGGSDRHQPTYPDPDPAFLQVGSPTTWLELSELSVVGVLDAIRAGRAFVSEGPEGPRVGLSVGGVGMGGTVNGGDGVEAVARVQGAKGDLLHWVSGSGVLRETLIETDDFTDAWTWKTASPYLRLEVVAGASLPAFERELRGLGRAGKFPRHLSAEAILRRPWRRALSNPVYLQPIPLS